MFFHETTSNVPKKRGTLSMQEKTKTIHLFAKWNCPMSRPPGDSRQARMWKVGGFQTTQKHDTMPCSHARNDVPYGNMTEFFWLQ